MIVKPNNCFDYRKYNDTSGHLLSQRTSDSDQFISRQSRCGRFINNTLFANRCCKYPFQVVITGRNEVVAKVMFLHVCVILFTSEGSLGSPQGRENPPVGRTPPDQAEPPDQADTPLDQADTPPGQGRSPLEDDCSIRSISCRYASYLNAFLFC